MWSRGSSPDWSGVGISERRNSSRYMLVFSCVRSAAQSVRILKAHCCFAMLG